MNAFEAFDEIADAYDRWYDLPRGRTIFEAELACLRPLADCCTGRWLEVGVGTGRFAKALGIGEGLDPAVNMLKHAKRRGAVVKAGRAEALPYRRSCFDGILLALTLCFVEEPEKALTECARVLTPGGRLVLGMVTADSPWGQRYRWDGMHGHPIYSHARFRTVQEVIMMAEKVGFTLREARSALFPGPECDSAELAATRDGIVEEAGFAGLRFGPGPATPA
jgi:ubiquinone/menaquinone biosynthesis C-methylase UbiE